MPLMSSARYLVTGAAGFVGAAVARALVSNGAEVHGASRSARAGPEGVRMHQCDLLTGEGVVALLETVRPTHLIHAAWDVTHGVYWTAPTNMAWLAASVHLLDQFFAFGGQRAVGVGTCAEYTWPQADFVERTSATAPHTPYGQCKLALFHAFEAARLMGRSVSWARLFFPYGPGDGEARFLPSMIRTLIAGRAFDTTSGEQIRDFVYIADIGEAISAIARSDVQGPVNVASGAGAALKDVAQEAARQLGAAPDLLRFGALPNRPDDPASIVGDVRRLTEEVGYRPQIDWRTGVKLTIQARAETRPNAAGGLQ